MDINTMCLFICCVQFLLITIYFIMQVEIAKTPFILDIFGFSGFAINGDYSATAMVLMDKMWEVVKKNQLPNKGLNVWVYEALDSIFTGVELLSRPDERISLEKKHITLVKYAHTKHFGSYGQIGNTYEAMKIWLKNQGLVTALPYIEIYGHWKNDESKLETDLFIALE